jgi:hypothetical protein
MLAEMGVTIENDSLSVSKCCVGYYPSEVVKVP